MVGVWCVRTLVVWGEADVSGWPGVGARQVGAHLHPERATAARELLSRAACAHPHPRHPPPRRRPQSDVNVRLVAGMRAGVKKRVNVEELAAGLNKRKIIEKAVFDELVSMLDGGGDDEKDPAKRGGKDAASSSYGVVGKGKPHVVMFVGLQGSGKTTTCTKYAYWHKKKGWKPALVCADTFRAGAFGRGPRGGGGGERARLRGGPRPLPEWGGGAVVVRMHTTAF